MKPSDIVPQVEYLLLDDANQYKGIAYHARTATSWQATYFLEMVKIYAGSWPDGNMESGEPKFRMPPANEIIERASSVVDAAIAHVMQRGWCVTVPSVEELRKEHTGVGFNARTNSR